MTKQPKRKRPKQLGAPNVLPLRVNAKHNNFVSRGIYPTTLDGVAVQLSANSQEHTYTLPELEGETYRTLRQYGLCLARYSIVDKAKFLKRRRFASQTLAVAERVVANYVYRVIFGDDPSEGTVHLAPLQSALKGDEPSYEAIMATLSYVGTKAFDELLASAHGDTNTVLAQTFARIEHRCASYEHNGSWYKGSTIDDIQRYIGRSDRRAKAQVTWCYEQLCAIIEQCHNELDKLKQRKNESPIGQPDAGKASKGKRKQPPRAVKPLGKSVGWCRAVLQKPELTISHTGKMGRRVIANNEGKHIRNISRLVTDPERRIFSRKTRSLGGIVVVDCSGSMSLTDEELRLIMKSSAGCTVIAYSDGDADDPNIPNIWVVARKGRQVRQLPEFPGGNGVDGPALIYALSLRTHNCPMVWISDTMVTGNGLIGGRTLRKQCIDLCRKHNIHIVNTAEAASELLTKLQSGQIVKPQHEREDDEQ